jgi:hypothetical protein
MAITEAAVQVTLLQLSKEKEENSQINYECTVLLLIKK